MPVLLQTNMIPKNNIIIVFLFHLYFINLWDFLMEVVSTLNLSRGVASLFSVALHCITVHYNRAKSNHIYIYHIYHIIFI